MLRRDFVAYGSAALVAGALAGRQAQQPAQAQAGATPSVSFELHIEEIYEEMIDGEVLFSLAYRDPVTRRLRPVLYVPEGAYVTIRITNKTRRHRRFALTGSPDGFFPAIAPGATGSVVFQAPEPGSYIYHENAEGAVGRVLGLFGAMMVAPTDGTTPYGAKTPYALPTVAQCALFDSFGVSDRFPGERWRHDLVERTRTWVVNQFDPVLCAAAERDEPTNPATLTRTFRPRYFMLNGLSGFDSAHYPETLARGYIGEPLLIRSLNAGLSTHALHIHGNHVFQLGGVGPLGELTKYDSILEIDTWMLRPMWRVDVLLPFKRPDDIPAAAWPPKEEKFPLVYPMHCHIEMSQTAGGGNYPLGLIADWEILGDRRIAT